MIKPRLADLQGGVLCVALFFLLKVLIDLYGFVGV